MNIAILPPTIPNAIWLNATELNDAPSRARSPSEAEVKIKKPAATKTTIILSKMVSTGFRLFRLMRWLRERRQ
jgi:hypothetical protein